MENANASYVVKAAETLCVDTGSVTVTDICEDKKLTELVAMVLRELDAIWAVLEHGDAALPDGDEGRPRGNAEETLANIWQMLAGAYNFSRTIRERLEKLVQRL